MSKSITFDKSKAFAVRVVRLYKWLREKKGESVMSKQLLRAGTSIGANLAEAQGAISQRDFATKVYISYKECKETKYWIELLHDTDYLSEKEYESIAADIIELEKLLTAITKKISQRKNSNR